MFRIDKVISNDNDFATFKNQYSKLLKESNLGNVKVVVDGKYNRSFIAKDWLAQRGFLMSKSTKPLLSPSRSSSTGGNSDCPEVLSGGNDLQGSLHINHQSSAGTACAFLLPGPKILSSFGAFRS